MRKLLFLLFLFGGGLSAAAQSTLASINGTVRDPSGAVVPNARVLLHRQESNTERTVTTGPNGEYNALNLEPGSYVLQVTAAGFARTTVRNISLEARQQLRFDAALTISRNGDTVTVNATDAGTINTDNAAISASLLPEAVLDLPANYRGAGSTSPLNVVQTLPGVQPDTGSFPPQPSASPNPGVKFSIQGGLPSQSETTVDGISAQDQTTNNIEGDAFPSAESIAEIRVDGVNNNAEYGQPGEITTVTKSGTDHVHGSLFWYFQNSGFDAKPYGSGVKPKKVANDFGANAGGPVPALTRGRYKSFFFGTYEGLRFPQAETVQYVVPTVLEKQGNFSQEVATLTNPFTGQPYANATLLPNASSAALLSLFPDPNLHVGESVQQVLADPVTPYNYVANKRNDIDSNQFDVRLDENIGERSTLFARFTSKQIAQTVPESLAIPNGTSYAHYRIFASAWSFAFTPHLVNELRFGFTLEGDGTSNPLNGTTLTDAAKFSGIQTSFPFNGVPFLGFDQLTSTTTNIGGSRLNDVERSRLFQYVDNLTWQKGAHTLKFGSDIRRLDAYTPLSISGYGDNYGSFFFHQSTSFTGNEFADFLAGVPYNSETADVTSDNNGTATAYALYTQDNWKATSRLNLTFGLRYELHPGFAATNGNIGNFDPSVARSGRVIYPAGYAGLLSVPELQSFNACATTGVNNPAATGVAVGGVPCTPVQSNVEAGLPAALRTAPRLRFEPRLGFAFRPFGNDRTAIRGGAGYYNITTSGALFYALTGTLQSNLESFQNYAVDPATGTVEPPAFAFPNVSSASALNTAPYGSGTFYSAVDIHWHDPYSLQTDLSVDQDLGRGFGLRASYIGLHTWHLVWQPELNMLQPSTTAIASSQPRTAFPFPNFYAIYNRSTEAQADYHSGQVELSHRFSRGYSFDTAYTLAKNLSDNQGTYGAYQQAGNFVDEQGGYDATDTYDRHLDYGNVTGTRRNRWLTTGVFELPVGRGKRLGGGMGRVADLAVGGWQVSSIFVWQSGPYVTAFLPSGTIDPSGTGSGTLFYRSQRPDRVGSGKAAQRSASSWFDKNAFTCPGTPGGISTLTAVNGASPCTVGAATAPIGRFGTESVGDLVGPGTVSLSAGLSKAFAITESVHLRAEGTFTNVLNHTNLADPLLDVTNPAFGVITAARGSDFGGNRTGQVSMKLEF